MKKPSSMVATVRGKRLEHDGPMRFGGVLRKLDFEDKTQKTHQYFLKRGSFQNSNTNLKRKFSCCGQLSFY
jgi:hypothetical protein